MIEYSIIIPHKNIPKLLQRCLDSIPLRDDLEVIVVDDNSNPSIVDFEHFPGMERPDTTVFFDKSGKGAGRARNIGLEHAKGKWLLFADADDYFNYCIRDILSEYKKDESDIIFFSASSVDCETYNNVDRADYIVAFINRYLSNPEAGEKYLRYDHGAPWGKIIKKSLIDQHKIRFQETRQHEDTKFSYSVGFYADKIKVDKRAMYCLTYRPSSMTFTISEEKMLDRVRVLCERYVFLKSHNISLPNIALYVEPLADIKERGETDIYAKCLRILPDFSISITEAEKLVKSELNRRKKMRREDFFSKVRDRLAIRTRIRKLFR
ncbi:MAG: glycosyltransferase family 2 protein [Bacteroidales bacterium]|jgi:glycosyltransferase involved in cell wall biosynthesis|nr:glycosyltransferase family 2 protein [Bacteroidales bacterium]